MGESQKEFPRPCPQSCLVSIPTRLQGPGHSALLDDHYMALSQTDLEFHLGSILPVTKSNLFIARWQNGGPARARRNFISPSKTAHVAETSVTLCLTSLRSLWFSLTPESAGYQVRSAKQDVVTALAFLTMSGTFLSPDGQKRRSQGNRLESVWKARVVVPNCSSECTL